MNNSIQLGIKEYHVFYKDKQNPLMDNFVIGRNIKEVREWFKLQPEYEGCTLLSITVSNDKITFPFKERF